LLAAVSEHVVTGPTRHARSDPWEPLETELGGDVETPESLRFSRKESRWERLGWLGVSLILLAGVAGLLGGGGIGNRRETGIGSTLVAYSATMRAYARDTLEVSADSRDRRLRISVGRAFLDRVELERILPEPSEVASETDWVTFTFETPGGDHQGIRFSFIPQRAGRLEGLVRIDGGAPIGFSSFVFP
jgi:hypothetical protein